MTTFSKIIMILYTTSIVILCIYAVHRYYLIFLYWKCYKKRENRKNIKWPDEKPFPAVTVQLPIYNEMYVVERLIDSVCNINYPKDLLEVQVLDDSTDDTCKIANEKVKEWKNKGFNINYIHRDTREGFKAGALANGLKYCNGEYILIFDADFISPSDILFSMLPYFLDEKVGMVQTRWGHINSNYSLLTKLQAMFLDAHFMIEHTARNYSGKFFNFNGTAGIWRKETIINAGGWHYDTLTEDLDLSYRAQLKGWEFIFLPNLVCPAELPVEINSFKAQQRRWAKGSIQTGKKILPEIWRSKKLSFLVKFEATIHLFANFGYVFTTLLAFLFPLSLFARNHLNLRNFLYGEIIVFLLATVPILTYFAYAQKEIYGPNKMKLAYLPSLVAVGIGISLNNAIAVFEAFVNKKSSFNRTAKFMIEKKGDNWNNKVYKTPVDILPLIEIFGVVYLYITLLYALKINMWGSVPFVFLFLYGYSYVGIFSVLQALERFASVLGTSEPFNKKS